MFIQIHIVKAGFYFYYPLISNCQSLNYLENLTNFPHCRNFTTSWNKIEILIFKLKQKCLIIYHLQNDIINNLAQLNEILLSIVFKILK